MRRLWAAGLVLAMTMTGCSRDGQSGSPSETGTGGPGPSSAAAEGPGRSTSGSPSSGSSTGSSTGAASSSSPGDERAVPTFQPTPAEFAAARADVARLTDAQLAGQLVIGTYSGTDPQQAAAAVRAQGLAGVIVFSANVPEAPAERATTMSATRAAIQAELKASGRSWPAAFAIDQEGGPVTRLRDPFTPWPAAMALGATATKDLPRRVGYASGTDLRAAGFTLVFAPDADVTEGSSPSIGVRSPGSDPRAVARVSTGLSLGYLDAGMVPSPKHFPGLATLPQDSHESLPRQHADAATLASRELVPFADAVTHQLPMLMVGHVLVPAWDPTYPASVSRKVLTDRLRGEMGYQGLIITDSMSMGALAAFGSPGERSVLALQAGVDVLLMPPQVQTVVPEVAKAISDGRLDRARLRESAARLVALLRHQEKQVRTPPVAQVGQGAPVAQELARGSVTQLGGTCGKRLVGSAITVQGGTAGERERFVAAAQRAGLRVQTGGTPVSLVGYGGSMAGEAGAERDAAGAGKVVVALDDPRALASLPAGTVGIATYGGNQAPSFDAVVAVLLGTQRAQGRLPVPVGQHAAGAGCP